MSAFFNATFLFSQLVSDNFLRSMSDEDILQFDFKFVTRKEILVRYFSNATPQNTSVSKVKTINQKDKKNIPLSNDNAEKSIYKSQLHIS